MALTLALPLIGLNPERFSTLSAKLLKLEQDEQNSRNSPDSGRASPSTGSESSGISSLALSGESALAELTPISSRSESPTRVPYKEINAPLRIMHGGRDILNLGANIRSSFNWEITDRKLSRYEIQNIIATRSVYYRVREQSHDYSVTPCDECGFCEQS
ncbi:uncharacterized protein [Anoplolepis gracilipes]|uniref:uncharacterized protein n=1 Tax=Anoplolepis gracilipes TaxID=354296 RepID=UPI003B9FE012